MEAPRYPDPFTEFAPRIPEHWDVQVDTGHFMADISFQNYDVVIMQGRLGGGKTKQAIRACNEVLGGASDSDPAAGPGRTALMLSVRILLTLNLQSRFAQDGHHFTPYFDPACKGMYDLGEVDRLIVSVESLMRVLTSRDRDFLILDEADACLAQMSSKQTFRVPADRRASCFMALLELLQTSRKILVADGYISDRTIDFLAKVLPRDRRVLFLKNTTRLAGRRAVELKPSPPATSRKDKKNRKTDKVSLAQRIKADILAGRNVAVFASSKTFTKELFANLSADAEVVAALKSRGLKAKDYHADKADLDNADVKDVENKWRTLGLLVYSPVITCGVDFTAAHFHVFYAYLDVRSCNCRVAAQAIGRVRNLVDNTVYFYITGVNPRVAHAYSRQGVRDEFQQRAADFARMIKEHRAAVFGRQCKQFALMEDTTLDWKQDQVTRALRQSQVVEEETPAVLRSLLADNEAEDRMHQLSYRPIMRQFFGEAGYDMSHKEGVDPGPPVGMQPVEWALPTKKFAYDDIPVVTTDGLLEVLERINAHEASEEDKAIMKRHLFDQVLIGGLRLSDDDRAKLYDKDYKTQWTKDLLDLALETRRQTASRVASVGADSRFVLVQRIRALLEAIGFQDGVDSDGDAAVDRVAEPVKAVLLAEANALHVLAKCKVSTTPNASGPPDKSKREASRNPVAPRSATPRTRGRAVPSS